MTPDEIADELEWVREDFRQLVRSSTRADLRRPSDGTRWTNGQLLFHMLLGFLIVRTLLPLVTTFSRAPDGWSRRFAAGLNAVQRPFHVVNYLGPVVGARLLTPATMERLANWVIGSLQRSLDSRDEQGLARQMHFPTTWDPYFLDTMTISHVFRFAAQHYDHHRRQLTIDGSPGQ
jgi:DinB superfamily